VVLASIFQTGIAAAQVIRQPNRRLASVDYLDPAVVPASNMTIMGDFSFTAKACLPGKHHAKETGLSMGPTKC
jgi:hypothetical protein